MVVIICIYFIAICHNFISFNVRYHVPNSTISATFVTVAPLAPSATLSTSILCWNKIDQSYFPFPYRQIFYNLSRIFLGKQNKTFILEVKILVDIYLQEASHLPITVLYFINQSYDVKSCDNSCHTRQIISSIKFFTSFYSLCIEMFNDKHM